MLGVSPWDMLVIAAAFGLTVVIGLVSSRRVKKETDFYVAGRRLGPVLQFFMNFGLMTDTASAPVTAAEVFKTGASGLWLAYQPLFSTPFYWFFPVWWRRTRLITASDQFIERFNSRKLSMIMAWYTVIVAILSGALGNVVAYKVAAAMFVKPVAQYTPADRQSVAQFKEYTALRKEYGKGLLPPAEKKLFSKLRGEYEAGILKSFVSYLTPVPFYIVYTAVIIVYIVSGGMRAAAYTDALQGILIIILSVLLLPMGLHELGGFAGLHQVIPAAKFDLFGASQTGTAWTWQSISAFGLLGLICMAFPNGVPMSGRDEKAVRIGVVGGAFGKRIIMFGWILCGLIALGLMQGKLADPENAWGALSRQLLGPGLLGLMIAGILLGHMPAIGVFAINFSATFTRNIYEPLAPGRSSRHYMWVAKSAVAGILIWSVLAAIFFAGIVKIFVMLIVLAAFPGAVGLLMFFWRGLSSRAVGIGWVLWFVLVSVLPWTLPLSKSFSSLPSLTVETPQRIEYAANQINRPGRSLTPVKVSQVIPPQPIFFQKVYPANPGIVGSTPTGHGRFRIEIYLLSLLGVPVQNFSPGGIATAEYLFDALGPLIILIGLTYALPRKRPYVPADPNSPEAAIVSPEEYAEVIMNGNISLLYRRRETAEQERVRLDRFFAKFRTPVPGDLEVEKQELIKSFRDPSRFDHRKLFPKTQWEISKCRLVDFWGFVLCWLGVVVVILLLWGMLNLGG